MIQQRYGRRVLRAQVASGDGGMEDREIELDTPDTADAVHKLFGDDRVITVHSEEASLEDIFIQVTGRGLTQ